MTPKPERPEQPKLEECRKCGYVACICPVLRGHRPECKFRRTVLTVCDTHNRIACKECKVVVKECAEHHVVACSICNPCDCKGK